MHTQWSAECGAEDPVLVVPWHDPDNADGARFIDLRENPYDLDQIPEAEAHPPLLQALRALNSPRSPVYTAKCDAWAMDEDEVAEAQGELDRTPEDAPAGFCSYLDLLWRERSLFVSFHQCEQRVMRLLRLAEALDLPESMLECVLRPAMVDLEGIVPARVQEGFAVTLYVKTLGTDAAHAYQRWSEALQAAVTLLRGRDFAGNG